MSKTTLIGIVILILISIGLWYVSSSKNIEVGTPETTSTSLLVATTTITNTATAKTSVTSAKPASNTFHSIFAQPGSHQCTFSQVNSSGQSTNVIYIADDKMRGEFRTIGMPTNIMLYNGGYLYTWKEGATNGVRTTVHSVDDLPQAIPKNLTSGAIIGNNTNSVGWDCHDWIKDAKLLSVPTYVKFTVSA